MSGLSRCSQCHKPALKEKDTRFPAMPWLEDGLCSRCRDKAKPETDEDILRRQNAGLNAWMRKRFFGAKK